MKKSLICFFYLFTSTLQSQNFIPLDEDTMEFISDVNYSLYHKNKKIYSNLTSKDSITIIPKNIVFDSISFDKNDFLATGLSSFNLKDKVFLKKKYLNIEEVIIKSNKNKNNFIGEQSRFVKKNSSILLDEPIYGLFFKEDNFKNKNVKKLIFFIEKVKTKTHYKVRIYKANEIEYFFSPKKLELENLIYESDLQTLEIGQKNKIEIDLKNIDNEIINQDIFVSIELVDYVDVNEIKIFPDLINKTKIKFQISNLSNFYSKFYDKDSKTFTSDYININAKINYDFAFQFFQKPHKSLLVAPAIFFITE